MAHIMTKRGNLDNIVTYQHICDTTADLSNISQEYRTLGSIAIVIEGEGGGLEIYITNSNKQWIPLTVSSTSSGEGVTLAEVNELIADALEDITGFNTQIVNELPESDINTGTIYLVANNNGNDNGYDEYIYVNNNWQKIGSTTNIQQLHNIRDGHGQSSIEEGNLSSSGGVSATGQYSHAEGYSTTASNYTSHAQGAGTTASGSQSHAQGAGTTASGSQSHAEGASTTASGHQSHAEGASTAASGTQSHAEGVFTIANHRSQHVFGEYNIADDNISASDVHGTYVEIVGNGTSKVLRSNARTLDWSGNEYLAGDLTLAGNINRGRKADTTVGEGSFAFGAEITASGQYSHAEGSNTTASHANTHAEGNLTTASGAGSHAEGSGTTASGVYSHAEGGGTTASGLNSHAEGGGTIASDKQSHAEGEGAIASGSQSHAEGTNTIANHKSQHVFGEYNIADDNISASNARGTYVEIVGNGTNTNNRSNARTLDWNGNQTLAGTLTTSSNGITIGNTTLTEAQLQSIFTRLAALEQAAPASGNNANYLEVDNGYIGG